MLVLADASAAREQLVTDLVVLGYRPLLHPEAERSPTQPGPGVALILTDDVRNHAVPNSEALRRTEAGRSMPLLWLVDESDLGNLPGNEHLLDEFLDRAVSHRGAGGAARAAPSSFGGRTRRRGPPRAARPEPAHVPGAGWTAGRST